MSFSDEGTPLTASSKEKSQIDQLQETNHTPAADEPVSYVATGTGLLLGLWRPGQVLSTDVPKRLADRVALGSDDIRSIIFLTVVALVVRLWNISSPPNMVYEEAVQVHRINNYLSGRFFYDLNPPLSTEFYALIARFLGYTGKFPATSESYIGHSFPFIELRSAIAILGVSSVVLTFLTLKLSGVTRLSALLGSIFIAFESTFVLEHRFIFTMPLSLTLLAASVYLWKVFELKKPLSLSWHGSALLLGSFVGLAASTRLASISTIYWLVGAAVYQLWWSFGDIYEKKFIRRFVMSSVFRGIYFLFVPYFVYSLVIAIHLQLTPASGEGDIRASGPFQSTLIGTPSSSVVGPVGVGSFITLRHMKTNVYLHSHDYYYPHGSFQQQVTGYGYRDSNNYWMIENIADSGSGEFVQLKNESYVKFRHLQTLKRLHTHQKRPPVSDVDWQFEVTAYGANGYAGDLNDVWKIETVNISKSVDSMGNIYAIDTVFKLRHLILGCYLLTHPRKLPEYGFEQQEVTCAFHAKPEMLYWYVETNYHPKHSNESMVAYDPLSFPRKMDEYKDIMELAKVSALDDYSGYDTSAWKLPFVFNGTPVFRSHYRQTILLGNVIVWYSGLAAIVFYALFRVYTALAVWGSWRTFENVPGIKEFDHHAGSFLFLWLCHYLPTFVEEQKLTAADYLPALYCQILLFARVWDFISVSIIKHKIVYTALTFVFAASSISFFVLYSPFVYNSPIVAGTCRDLEIFPSWDFGCGYHFPTQQEYDAYESQYSNYINYHYISPPAEELTPATIARTALKANPTGALVKPRNYTDTEVIVAMAEYKNATSGDDTVREKLLYLEQQKQLVWNINEKIKKKKRAAGIFEDDKMEELETIKVVNGTMTVNIDNVSRIQGEWLRITDPPSVNFTGKTYADMSRIEQELLSQQGSVISDSGTLGQGEGDEMPIEQNPLSEGTKEEFDEEVEFGL